jgi:hypothetical protein
MVFFVAVMTFHGLGGEHKCKHSKNQRLNRPDIISTRRKLRRAAATRNAMMNSTAAAKIFRKDGRPTIIR